MTTILGHYTDTINSYEYLTLTFSPQQFSIQDRWRSNGVSADFLADYWATFFPATETMMLRKQAHVKEALSYIANELLENMMKFHSKDAEYPLSITLYLFSDTLLFYAINCVEPASAQRFQAYITTLLASDLQQFYLAQLEKNALDETHSSSGLGYLTMMHDYGAELGWKFESLEPSTYHRVTTMVRLPI